MSRSLLVTGQAFSFPIDFSAAWHLDLVSTPENVQNYARDQAMLLSACWEVYHVLLEHRAWHRGYINENDLTLASITLVILSLLVAQPAQMLKVNVSVSSCIR
jgi:hypothetical protein